MNQESSIGKVLESSSSEILVEINDTKTFEDNKEFLQVGKFLVISDGNINRVICRIQTLKSTNGEDKESFKFTALVIPVGYIENDSFRRGAASVPSPTEPVFIFSSEVSKIVFEGDSSYNFPFGKLVQNSTVDLKVDANRLFSKHIAIVGSTGSGKSCAVAKIIQDVVGIGNALNKNLTNQKNAHIIIFDIHSEYKSAFSLNSDQAFSLNYLDNSKLLLPYWLMNSEELEALFIEGNEGNFHNQVSQFKRAVILNKEKHNPSIKERVNYDTPVYFDINEVYTYLWNVNNEVIGKLSGENCPKLANGELIQDGEKSKYFEEKLDFATPSTARETKASNGAFNGELNRFLSRLETKLNDKRLDFILRPRNAEGNPLITTDFSYLLRQFLGYVQKSNISIIDLSGVPFEVLSITVSLVSRLVFDFAFHYSKSQHDQGLTNDVPFMIVCEEAHNYIPRSGGAEYSASKKSLERIAKEGRKYGLSLMVVSQRPSEVSETIFSQCSNFIALRLTNVNDQNYVKSLLPENTSSITSVLPNLSSGECILVGDSTLLPSVVKLELPNPQPKSETISFFSEWENPWVNLDVNYAVKRWTFLSE